MDQGQDAQGPPAIEVTKYLRKCHRVSLTKLNFVILVLVNGVSVFGQLSSKLTAKACQSLMFQRFSGLPIKSPIFDGNRRINFSRLGEERITVYMEKNFRIFTESCIFLLY
ncbi:MAG TPA: hypothetical protein DCO82_02690 [Alphaproteobacteria bacterium]|nr:hypothetical protein [Alphaproteobacteria bacterium]